jgi:hypothetical protein
LEQEIGHNNKITRERKLERRYDYVVKGADVEKI